MAARTAPKRGVASLKFEQMTRTERVMAAVRGEPLDRLPVCFWHHFQANGSGRRLADASLRFFDEEYDLDILKLMPDVPYPFPNRSISSPEQWRLFEPIDPGRSRFFTQRVEAVGALRDELGYETPIIVTLFSPLTEALFAAVDQQHFLQHAREAGPVVHEALATIAENLRAHIRDVIAAGADGVFFAIMGATAAIMPTELYRELGRSYDLLALQGAENGWLNVLHIHGERDLHFTTVLDYPVDVVSWSDRLAGPSLKEARAVTSKCLMGGWHEVGALSKGPEKDIVAEAQDAIAQTGGRKLILAGGCSVPDDTDPRWLHAARDAVEELELP